MAKKSWECLADLHNRTIFSDCLKTLTFYVSNESDCSCIKNFQQRCWRKIKGTEWKSQYKVKSRDYQMKMAKNNIMIMIYLNYIAFTIQKLVTQLCMNKFLTKNAIHQYTMLKMILKYQMVNKIHSLLIKLLVKNNYSIVEVVIIVMS